MTDKRNWDLSHQDKAMAQKQLQKAKQLEKQNIAKGARYVKTNYKTYTLINDSNKQTNSQTN